MKISSRALLASLRQIEGVVGVALVLTSPRILQRGAYLDAWVCALCEHPMLVRVTQWREL